MDPENSDQGIYTVYVSKVRFQSNFCEDARDKIISGNMHIWFSNMYITYSNMYIMLYD